MGTKQLGRDFTLFIIFIVSFGVILGHYFGIDSITKIGKNNVTMKMGTAVMFMISSVAIKFRNQALFAVLATLDVAIYLSFRNCGIECIFPNMSFHQVQTIAVGLPSHATLFCFFLVSLYSIKNVRKFLAWIVCAAALQAIVGYIFGIPPLYYYYKGMSTAMAIHTAIFFLLIGGIMINDANED